MVNEYVSTRLDRWRYGGEKFKELEGIFNDDIIFTVQTYADVIHINAQLLKTGNEISDYLPDIHKSRESIRILIANARHLQA
eukprot:364257-Ditylum_brightwellii.AAC.1